MKTSWIYKYLRGVIPVGNEVGQGNIFSSVCQEFCPQAGGRYTPLDRYPLWTGAPLDSPPKQVHPMVNEQECILVLKGVFTLCGNGTGTSTGTNWKVQYRVEMFTLIRDKDRDQDPLLPIVPVPYPVPVVMLLRAVWISHRSTYELSKTSCLVQTRLHSTSGNDFHFR